MSFDKFDAMQWIGHKDDAVVNEHNAIVSRLVARAEKAEKAEQEARTELAGKRYLEAERDELRARVDYLEDELRELRHAAQHGDAQRAHEVTKLRERVDYLESAIKLGGAAYRAVRMPDVQAIERRVDLLTWLVENPGSWGAAELADELEDDRIQLETIVSDMLVLERLGVVEGRDRVTNSERWWSALIGLRARIYEAGIRALVSQVEP